MGKIRWYTTEKFIFCSRVLNEYQAFLVNNHYEMIDCYLVMRSRVNVNL